MSEKSLDTVEQWIDEIYNKYIETHRYSNDDDTMEWVRITDGGRYVEVYVVENGFHIQGMVQGTEIDERISASKSELQEVLSTVF